jgi:hypothetical protein
LGQEDFTLFYQDSYDCVVGKWGYQTTCLTLFINAATATDTIYLKKGFYDDFSFNFGWSVLGDAETGMWERAEPNPTTGTVFDLDAALDCSDKCMVTGNGTTPNTDQNDVDNGFTTLISPVFALTDLTNPHLNYARSFYCYHGPGAFNDTLRVLLSNGLDQVVLEEIVAPQGQAMAWEYKSFALNGLLPFTNSMQLFVRTADDQDNPNITEAAFDHFSISNAPILTDDQLEKDPILLFPNPGQDELTIGALNAPTTVKFFQLDGKLCLTAELGTSPTQIDTHALPNGAYIIEIGAERHSWIKLGQ